MSLNNEERSMLDTLGNKADKLIIALTIITKNPTEGLAVLAIVASFIISKDPTETNEGDSTKEKYDMFIDFVNALTKDKDKANV